MNIKSINIKFLAFLGILTIACQNRLICSDHQSKINLFHVYRNPDKYYTSFHIPLEIAARKTVVISGLITLGTTIGFYIGNCVPFMPVMKYDRDGTPDWTPAVIKLLGSTSVGAIMGLIAGIKTARSICEASDYNKEDLLSVYIAWANKENRLPQLMDEARYYAPQRIVEYMEGNQHIASVNANDLTINTNIGNGKFVKLGYLDLFKLLEDETIINLANKLLEKIN